MKRFNAVFDWLFVDHAKGMSLFWMALAVIIGFATLTGCSSAGKVVDVATVPGTDKRCVMGFCYEREREVDVEALEALTEYLKARESE